MTPVLAGGDGGHQHLTAAMDKGGCWHLMVAMDGSCGSGGQQRGRSMAAMVVAFNGGGSIQWHLMASAMDYGKAMARQRWPAQQEDERVVKGEATQQPAGAMRGRKGSAMRGQ